MLSFIVLCAMGSWPFFSWLDLGKVGYQRSWHCWNGGCFSLGMSIWIQMHAKPSSSTWPQIPVILEGGEGGLHQERWLGAVGQLNRVERVCKQQSLSAYVCTQPGCTRARADGHAREFELEHRLRTMQRVRGRRPVAKCSFLCLPQRPGWFQRLSYPRQQKMLIQPFLLPLSRLRLALKELFRAVCLCAGLAKI